MKIYLIGYRCTGKTTVGKALADRLNYGFIDTDRLLEANTATTIAQIVEKQGWDAFRQIEQDILFSTKKFTDTIISTGGGIILNEQNRTFIRETGFCVWLQADIHTILQRLDADAKTSDSRPSLTDLDLIKETEQLLETRALLYKEAAQFEIDTSTNSPEQIVELISRRIDDVRQ